MMILLMTMMTTMTAMMMTKKPLHLRHELKHIISLQEDMVLTGRLRRLFAHDKNAGPQGTYRVSSLYFDTPTDKALRQKIDGVNCREKFRLRYYGSDLSFIRLEKKMKINGLCGKYSAAVTREQAELLLEGRNSFLLDTGDPLLTEFYSKLRGQLLRPRTLVVYDREAFLYDPGNVRVTLDRNLRTSLYSTDFLNPCRSDMDLSDGAVVLEVKYDAFLPDIVRMAVQVPDARTTAFSKYAVCRRYD